MSMIERLSNWFREHIFPRRKSEPDLRQTGVRVRPPSQRPGQPAARAGQPGKPARPAEQDLRFDTELGGRIEDGGPGKNVLVRSKYLREDTGTHEALKIIDETLTEDSEDAGFDPYNTGQFDRSRNWSRTRK